MKYLLAIATLALVGCASNPTVPETVQVPVAVKCKTEDPKEPTYRFQPPYENIFDATRDLMGDRELALAYEIELRAALKSCK